MQSVSVVNCNQTSSIKHIDTLAEENYILRCQLVDAERGFKTERAAWMEDRKRLLDRIFLLENEKNDKILLSNLSNEQCIKLFEKWGVASASTVLSKNITGQQLKHFTGVEDLKSVGLTTLPPFKYLQLMENISLLKKVGYVQKAMVLDVDGMKETSKTKGELEKEILTLNTELENVRKELQEAKENIVSFESSKKNGESKLVTLNVEVENVRKELQEGMEKIVSLEPRVIPVVKVTTTSTAAPSVVFDNKSLRAAVAIWIENREAAVAKYGEISNWDTSHITDMSYLFGNHTCYRSSCFKNFDEDISKWDVSQVTSMTGMFRGAVAFNHPLNSWNVSRVVDMSYMFDGAASFNQPLLSWNVERVRDMSFMFCNTSKFNQTLNSWNVSSVRKLKKMFVGSSYQCSLVDWNLVNSETNVNKIFHKQFPRSLYPRMLLK